jgi:anti-anti-sigma regulatory factor
MSIQRWSQDVILVELPEDLKKQKELQALPRMLRRGEVCDVVVDFSHVDVVGIACLAGLVELQRLLHDAGHKLTLCSVAPATKGIFTVAQVDDLFEFTEDRFTALASPQLVG